MRVKQSIRWRSYHTVHCVVCLYIQCKPSHLTLCFTGGSEAVGVVDALERLREAVCGHTEIHLVVGSGFKRSQLAVYGHP